MFIPDPTGAAMDDEDDKDIGDAAVAADEVEDNPIKCEAMQNNDVQRSAQALISIDDKTLDPSWLRENPTCDFFFPVKSNVSCAHQQYLAWRDECLMLGG